MDAGYMGDPTEASLHRVDSTPLQQVHNQHSGWHIALSPVRLCLQSATETNEFAEQLIPSLEATPSNVGQLATQVRQQKIRARNNGLVPRKRRVS